MLIDQVISEIQEAKQEMKNPSSSVEDSLNFLKQMKDHLGQRKTVTQMDAAVTQINNYKENTLATIKRIVENQNKTPNPTPTPQPVPPRKKIETVYRGTICPKRSINSEADIDAYVEGIRGRLKRLLMDSDGLKIE